MNNISYIQYINGKIVKHIDTNEYFVYVGAIYGYDNEHNYDDGFMFKINDDLINDTYSVEEIIKTKEESEYIYVPTEEEISNGLFNTYIPVHNIDITSYKLKNDINLYQFTENELSSFYVTFMNIIKNYANFDNENMVNLKNQIYRKVIEYYSNYQNDDALININLILKSTNLTYHDASQYSVVSSCNCNGTGASTTTENTCDCTSLYTNAMELYLKQMFGDVDFYYDFFHEDNVPINDLIDNLIRLIEEFKTLNKNLSFTESKSHCGCSTLSIDNGQCNYNVLDNFIQILNWVKNCKIEENINKIKVYGEQFGELLPHLYFA